MGDDDNYNRNRTGSSSSRNSGSSGGAWEPLELRIARAQAESAIANLEHHLLRSITSLTNTLNAASNAAAVNASSIPQNANPLPPAGPSTTTSAMDDLFWTSPSAAATPGMPPSFSFGAVNPGPTSFLFPSTNSPNPGSGGMAMSLGPNLLSSSAHPAILPFPPTTLPPLFPNPFDASNILPTTRMSLYADLQDLLLPTQQHVPVLTPPTPPPPAHSPFEIPADDDPMDSRDALSESPPSTMWGILRRPASIASITSSVSPHSSPLIGPFLAPPSASPSQPTAAGAVVTRKRRSRARSAVREVPCLCSVCSTPLGSMHLVGDEGDFATPFVCDVVCASCGGDEDGKKGKKRKRGSRRRVECRICLEAVGNGGCRVIAADEKRPGGEEIWVEPAFKSDMFCKSCEEDFRFCSSCGGGSTTRSGKWRPRQLFNASRKTCLLSHSRAGSASQLHSVSYRLLANSATHAVEYDPIVMLGDDMQDIPFAASPDCTADMAINELTPVIQDHVESTLLQTMDATIMRGSSLPTFDALSTRASHLRGEIGRFMNTTTASPNIRRYLNVVYSPDARPSGARRGATMGAGGWAVGACLAFYWHVEQRVVGCAFSSCRVQMSGRSDVLLQELRLSLLRIKRDADAGLERPAHVCLGVVKGGRLYARAEGVLRTCGFVTVGEYMGGLKMGGTAEREREEVKARLERACGMEVGQREAYETFVADCREEGELLTID